MSKQEWKTIKAEKKIAKKILNGKSNPFIPKQERMARRDANRLKQMIKNCKKNGYAEYRRGEGKRNLKKICKITQKPYWIHSRYKEKIPIEQLKMRLEKNESNL